jgi:hypothetical protein
MLVGAFVDRIKELELLELITIFISDLEGNPLTLNDRVWLGGI